MKFHILVAMTRRPRRAVVGQSEGGYGEDVPVGRSAPRPVPPVAHLEALDEWVGQWVAVKDSKVIAVAESSSALVYKLRMLGPRAHGAVTEYVRPGRDDAYIVGAG